MQDIDGLLNAVEWTSLAQEIEAPAGRAARQAMMDEFMSSGLAAGPQLGICPPHPKSFLGRPIEDHPPFGP